MTGTDVTTAARNDLLIDIDPADLRFSDAESIQWINEGMNRIYSLRPDAFYGTTVTVGPPTPITTLADTLELVDRFLATIVNYVCFRYFSKDSENASNRSRAADYNALYKSALIQGG